ncbi:MAG: glycosyltransferase family 4 protein [Planctomycetota bacterium]|nr:glycosyltransferase family 4 protein [Planctomycetota bacterium]
MEAGAPLTIAQANFHMLWGGQAEVVLALSQSLKARGHRVTVVCPAESELAARAAAAQLDVFTGCSFRKGFRPVSFLRDVARLGALLRRQQVRIYHCHGSQDHWIGALAAARYSPETRVFRTRHNIYPVRNHVFNRWLFRRKTAQVITIFGAQGRFFTDTGLLPAERLATLHSPLPQEFVNPGEVPRALRRELQLAGDVPLVGYVVNSFHPDKAPLDFVAAAATVARELPDVRFCMVGHGPLEGEIRARIEATGLAARFHLTGFRRDILPVMASFDLVVLTSVAREASSTVLKQAAALSLPVVATDVGGTAEVVAHSRTGLIVKPGDVAALAAAMRALLTDRPRAAAMGAAGKEKVLAEFTAAAIAEKTEALYRKAL